MSFVPGEVMIQWTTHIHLAHVPHIHITMGMISHIHPTIVISHTYPTIAMSMISYAHPVMPLIHDVCAQRVMLIDFMATLVKRAYRVAYNMTRTVQTIASIDSFNL